ncbi:CHAD domain-containing protein, partial [Patulibacter sp. S7RM1-6]
MSFRLDLDRPVAETTRRVTQERLERVIDELAGRRSDDPATAVHEARKDLKRTRSLVRLLRAGVPRKRYRRESAALREVARSLGASRDAAAMVETVDRLRERFAGRVPAATFERLRETLQARVPTGAEETSAAIEELRRIDARIAEGALDVDERAALVAGIARTYDRGRLAFRAADAEPTAELLHEWRKRVKDLWYQQELLGDAWPELLDVQAKEAKALSKVLGDDHDLSELDALLRAPDGPAAETPLDTDALLPLIAERRAELLADARA